MIHIEPASALDAPGLQRLVREYLGGRISLRDLDTALARIGEVVGALGDPRLTRLYGELALALAEFDCRDLGEIELRAELGRLAMPVITLGPRPGREMATGTGAAVTMGRRLTLSPAVGTRFEVGYASAAYR